MNIEDLSLQLREFLAARKIEEGKTLLAAQKAALASVSAGDPGAPDLTFIIACWAGASDTAAEFGPRLVSAYEDRGWPKIALVDWARIEAGKLLLALHENRHLEVDAGWRWFEDNKKRLGPCPELLATVTLVCARSHSRRANYPMADTFVDCAIRDYRESGLPLMAAVANVTKGWLQMKAGKLLLAIETSNEAFAALENTEDWTIRANISFTKSRCLCRLGHDEEARRALVDTIRLYKRSKPYHRNLRRALLELANLLHRMAIKPENKQRTKELRDHAAQAIEQTASLIKSDEKDTRNRIRLLLAQAHQALSIQHPKLFHARHCAKEAFEEAEQQADKLMMARAGLERAEIETREAHNMDEPNRGQVRACQHASEAWKVANEMSDARLKARISTFLGNLFLEKPFEDKAAAEQELDAAQTCMAGREDKDYVVQQIHELATKLNRLVLAKGSVR